MFSLSINALSLAGAHLLGVAANPALFDGLQGLLTDQCCLERCGQTSINLHAMTPLLSKLQHSSYNRIAAATFATGMIRTAVQYIDL